jgi:GTP pyrophosphokinase
MDTPLYAATSAEATVESPRSNSSRRSQDPAQLPLRPNPEYAASAVATKLVEGWSPYQRTKAERDRGERIIREAYAIAYEAHSQQRRKSGEPYIDHPVSVAHILIDLQLDADSIAAALLHDVIEDTLITRQQIEAHFGAEVGLLVDGVTKLSRFDGQTKEDAQAGSYRKMFVAMSEDPRVVLVKLADRLHNMRTINSMSIESQQRNARETLEIYAPLANRLGIWKMKWELEDRSFAIINPTRYHEIADQLKQRRTERERTIQRVITQLTKLLDKEGIKADVTGRPKHIYSIYRKMERKQVSLEQIYDQLAVRVIIDGDDTGACYRVLGMVHGTWPPVPGEFDDYIAMPKESMYQSLHTTVLIPTGQPCEVQIRTSAMHQVAENGIAAHWRYKEGFGRSEASFDHKLAWLRRLIEWRRDIHDSQEFVESLKSDELEEQVYVFTPKSKIIELPRGSSPVDFAYRIHSEIGNSCVGAKVNNRMVPLDYVLRNSDIVQILTSKNPRGPSHDWLNFVKTSGARNHIRRYFKKLHREQNIADGRDLLEKELKRLSISMSFDQIAAEFGFKSIDEVFLQIGGGDITARAVAQRLMTRLTPLKDEGESIPLIHSGKPAAAPKGIQVRGDGDGELLTRLARCCNPAPGEPIIGFVTRGKGITIHRVDCRMVRNEPNPERLLDLTWGADPPPEGYPVPVRIDAWDRVGLWKDVSSTIADAGINIDILEQVQSQRNDKVVLRVTLRIRSVGQLTQILDKLSRLKAVIEARRDTSQLVPDGSSA